MNTTPDVRLRIVSHTHWDREWYLPSRYTKRWLNDFFRALLARCSEDSGYRFLLDGQTILLADLQDSSLLPEIHAAVRRGQIALGPYYQQPDWNLVSGESLIRNLLIGLEDARQVGEPCMVGWLPDSFGQTAQTAQIHRLFGIRFLTVWRGIPLPPEQLACELSWRSPDGTEALTSYLIDSYRNAMQLARIPELASTRISWSQERLAPFASSGLMLLLNGYDQERRPEDIPSLLRSLKEAGPSFSGGLATENVKQSSLDEYFAELEEWQAQGGVCRQVSGRLYSGRYISVFPGVLSARTYLKVFNFRCQMLLSRYVEPLATLCLRSAPPESRTEGQGRITELWRKLLQNHPHDSLCGVSVDPVHTDMEYRFSELESELLALAAAFLPTESGWVFNPSPHSRYLTLPRPGSSNDEVYTLPALSLSRTDELTRCADVPPIQIDEQRYQIRTHSYIATVNADGTLDLASGDGSVEMRGLCALVDDGDAGDTYNYSAPRDNLRVTPMPDPERRWTRSASHTAGISVRYRLDLPERLTPDRSARSGARIRQEITVTYSFESASPLVSIHVAMTNSVKDHRLRMLFPTHLNSDALIHETQFAQERTGFYRPTTESDETLPASVARVMLGARERDPNTQVPMQRYAAVRRERDQHGCAVYVRGIHEVEPLPEESTIALTLLRSVGWLARPDLQSRIGDAGPLIFTPDAQCIRHLCWDLAVSVGDCSDPALLRQAEAFTCPVWTQAPGEKTPAQRAPAAEAPRADSGPSASGPKIEGAVGLSALKCAEHGPGYLLRLWNGTSMPQAVEIHESRGIQSCRTVSADEGTNDADGIAETPVVTEQRVAMTVLPWKIVSLRIVSGDAPQQRSQPKHTHRVPSPFEPIVPIADRESVPAPLDEHELHAEATRLQSLIEEIDSITPRRPPTIDLSDIEALARRSRISSLERERLEAKISYELNRFRLEEWKKGNRLPVREPVDLWSRLCELGDQLNEARVTKRLDDYVLDLARAGYAG